MTEDIDKKRTLQVFLSHDSAEVKLALIIKNDIKQYFPNQVDVFLSSDADSIQAGYRFLDVIQKTLNNSVALVVLCSPISIRRPWVNFEIGAAWNKNIPIVPVCHSGLKHSDLPIPLGEFQGGEVKNKSDLLKIYGLIAGHLNQPMPSVDFSQTIANVQKFEDSFQESSAQTQWLGDFGREDPRSELIGSWNSTWTIQKQGENVDQRETIEIQRVKGDRLWGVVRTETNSGKDCECPLRGIVNGKYLQILWSPPTWGDGPARHLNEYGCYFLERQDNGNYAGYATGVFWHIGEVSSYRQTVVRSGYEPMTGDRRAPRSP
jgi:hypothetical protein